jgi:glycosyltransferase involved in cell wall biosynthesis
VSVPRVTVLTTVYNGARYLEEAIDSIRAEEFQDFEHVIVDDGSTDATPQILARATARDSRIVLVRTETNHGIASAANRGLAIARGEYIARLDADDISLPGRLAREVAVLDAHPHVVLVSMNYESIDAHGVVIGRSHRDHPSAVLAYLLNFSNSIGGHSQVMFRKSVIHAVGGYDETCRAGLDYDLWTRIVPHGRIVVLPELGMRYRVHGESITRNGSGQQVAVAKRIVQRTLSEWLGRTLSDREVDALMHAWRPLVPAIDAKLADAILREAFALFREREPDQRMHRIVRKLTARRLINTSVLLLAKGDVGNALRHGLQALRWDAWMSIVRVLQVGKAKAASWNARRFRVR